MGGGGCGCGSGCGSGWVRSFCLGEEIYTEKESRRDEIEN